MSRKHEIAKAIADQTTEWFKERIRSAYLKGWDDAEKNMYEKADALMEVIHSERDEDG